jgi:hypothetical protein
LGVLPNGNRGVSCAIDCMPPQITDDRCYVGWFWHRYLALLDDVTEQSWRDNRRYYWQAARSDLETKVGVAKAAAICAAAIGAEHRTCGQARFARKLEEERRVIRNLLDGLDPSLLNQALTLLGNKPLN